jgi:quercetin dioxygenase-like cupin family protein
MQQGDVFESQIEGYRNLVQRLENNQVWLELTLKPHAKGPPEHLHLGFEEVFTVQAGRVRLRLSGKEQILHVGDTVRIPANTPHLLDNPHSETARLECNALPLAFVQGLGKLYAFGNANPKRLESPAALLFLAARGMGFDTWLAAVPLPAQKAMRLVLAPLALLLGY